MKIKDIMTRNVFTIGPPATVRTASKMMREKDVGSLVVLEDKKAVGIVTERDILKKVTAKKISPSTISVREVMSTPLICISNDMGIEEATELMIGKNIRRLPVSDNKGQCIGIVTERDIMRGLLKIFAEKK